MCIGTIGARLRKTVAGSRGLSAVAEWRFVVFRAFPGLHGWWCRHMSPLFHPEWRERCATRQSSGDALPWSEHILLVSHFADGTGAPLLLLNIARGFREAGFNPHVVLLRDGPLHGEFARYGSVDVVFDETEFAAVLDRLADCAITRAYLNTTVSGAYAGFLRQRGLDVVTLVHELAGVVQEMGLTEAARTVLEESSRIVVPSSLVVRSWKTIGLEFPADRTVVMPQPDFTDGLHRLEGADRASARSALRRKLGLPDDAIIVLGCGYLEYRKAPDTFFRVAKRVCERCPGVCFAWVGDCGAEDYRRGISALAAESRGRTFLLPYQKLDGIMNGADVFFLSSRNDPFPLVALMSARCGLPVVHCRTATGVADLFGTIPGCSAETHDDLLFAGLLEALVSDERMRSGAGKACCEAYAMKMPAFRDYVFELLRMSPRTPLPTVSCVIPNYNYAKFLRGRIESVACQTYRVDELIVLDDNSTDDSDVVIRELVREYGSRFPAGIRYVRNTVNAGVFRQWKRGAGQARGDIVWIAEADDGCSELLVSRLVHAFRHDSGVRIAYAQSALMDADGTFYRTDFLSHTNDISPELWRESWILPERTFVNRALAIRNVIPNASGALISRAAILALPEGLFAFKAAGDWFAYLEMLRAGSVAFWPESLNHYRRHRQSVIAKNHQTVTDEMMEIHLMTMRRYRLSDGTRRRMSEEYSVNCHVLGTDKRPIDYGITQTPGKENDHVI